MRKLFSAVLIFSIILSFLASNPRRASADGMVVSPDVYPVISSQQKALIIYDNDHEDLVISISFEGRASDFGWIVPLPNQPEISKVDSSIFRKLADFTSPKESLLDKLKGTGGYGVAYEGDIMNFDAGPAEGAKTTVQVIEEKSVGIFDYAILQTQDAEDLREWMKDNNYNLPASIDSKTNVQPIRPSQDKMWSDALPIIQNYIDSNWYFVTIKVNNKFIESTGVSTQLEKGQVDPLRFSFDTTDMIYPMKLTSLGKRSVSVQLYTITDHRMRVENYQRNYCSDDSEDCSLFGTYYASKIGKEDIAEITKEIGKGSWYEPKQDRYITELYSYAVPYDKMTEEMLFENTKTNAGVNDGSMTIGEWLILPVMLILYVPFWIFGGGLAGGLFYDDYGFAWFAIAILFFSLISFGWITLSIFLLKRTHKKLKRVIIYMLQFPAVSFVALGVSMLIAIPFAMGITALDLNEEAAMVDGICCFAFIIAIAPVVFYRLLWRRRSNNAVLRAIVDKEAKTN